MPRHYEITTALQESLQEFRKIKCLSEYPTLAVTTGPTERISR